jgi:hypothetical protein
MADNHNLDSRAFWRGSYLRVVRRDCARDNFKPSYDRCCLLPLPLAGARPIPRITASTTRSVATD